MTKTNKIFGFTVITCIFVKKLGKNCCFHVKFGGIFAKKAAKIQENDEK